MSRVGANIIRGRLSREERVVIEELVDKGFLAGQIAGRLNRHPSTINFAMHCAGLKQPVPRSVAYQRRDGSKVKSFGADEDTFIQALRCQNYTCAKIAEMSSKRFGHRRSAATVGVRLKMLANIDHDIAELPRRSFRQADIVRAVSGAERAGI